MASPSDPYAHLSLRDRLELLAFEARLAGYPESLIRTIWEAIDQLQSARADPIGRRSRRAA